MDGQTFVDDVRAEKRTELERLASDKALLAATGADLSAGTILETVALSLDGLRATFAEWADETTADPARSAFADAVASLDVDYERVASALDGNPAGDPPVPIPTIRRFEDPRAQVAAGFVSHGLVFDGTLLQAVSFFVNEAERGRADLMRDLRSRTDDRIDAGGTTLGTLCTDDGDWDVASTAAGAVVDAAYEAYVETLSGMGIDPKPVC